MMRHERSLIVAIIVALLAAVTVPYLWAYHVTPKGYVYTGLLWLPDDQNVHLTWAKEAAEGHFLFPNLYSTDRLGHPATFSNLVLWWVGVTARVTRVPLILVYHFYRLLFAGLCVGVFYRLTRVLTEDGRVRVAATFLVAFSAGFGYVAHLAGMDVSKVELMDLPRGVLFVPEAYAFTSALIYPLNVASLFLLAATYLMLLRAERTGRLGYAVLGGVAALVLGNSHTYDSLPLLATLGVHLVMTAGIGVRNKAFRVRAVLPGVIVLGLACLPVGVQAYLYFFSEEFRWSKTHYPVTPLPLVPTLLSFGPLVPLAIYGAWRTWREAGSRLMAVWAVVTVGLMYLPWLDFGRKLIEGFQLPLAYLAAVGLIDLVSRVRVGVAARRAIVAVCLVLCCLSVPVILRGVLRHRTDPSWPAPRTPLDLPADYAAALNYLDHLPADRKAGAVVLAMPPLANHLPPRTGLHTYVGHWAESIRFVSKFWAARHLYDGSMSAADAAEFLAKNHITYLLQSPDADPPAKVPPAERLGLPPAVFRAHGTAIYPTPTATTRP